MESSLWHTCEEMVLKYWTGAHTKHWLLYHLVFLPKYLKRVLRGKVARRIKDIIFQACRVNWWWAEEVNIQPDHLHLLLQIQPSESVADVVNRLKGGTSRAIRKEFPEIMEFLWGDSFWSDGYFAETTGHTSAEVIKRYIQEQQASMPPDSQKPRPLGRV